MDAIYDRFLSQDINLKIQPGVIEKYEWSPDKTKIDFTIRRVLRLILKLTVDLIGKWS